MISDYEGTLLLAHRVSVYILQNDTQNGGLVACMCDAICKLLLINNNCNQ